MMRSYSSDWKNPKKDWRLEQALWAYWMHDMDKVYAILTRVCHSKVVEDYYEQTEQAAH